MNPAEPQRMRLELRLALKPNEAMEALERWGRPDRGAPQKDDLGDAAGDAHRAPSGHGVSTRRPEDWRVCTAVCVTAAVGTIIWNPWKPSAQM